MAGGSFPFGLHDTHCHLDSKRFFEDFDSVVERARDVGVTRITTIGCAQSVDELDSALQVAQLCNEKYGGETTKEAWVTAAIGVHPHDASHWDETIAEALEAKGAQNLVVAIGETGLDYHYDYSPREKQQEAFRETIAIARTLKKPLVVHTRSAPEDTLRILREENAQDAGGIIHCFSEDLNFAKQALDMGFVCSFSGIVTFKNAQAIREAAANIPDDTFLIETDAPYLAPVPQRGKRNEPSFVRHTAECLAELRNTTIEKVAEQSFENAARTFGL